MEKMSDKVTSVRLCSPYNSTKFTVCCGVAVLDHESECGKCGAHVPNAGDSEARWAMAKACSPLNYYS